MIFSGAVLIVLIIIGKHFTQINSLPQFHDFYPKFTPPFSPYTIPFLRLACIVGLLHPSNNLVWWQCCELLWVHRQRHACVHKLEAEERQQPHQRSAGDDHIDAGVSCLGRTSLPTGIIIDDNEVVTRIIIYGDEVSCRNGNEMKRVTGQIWWGWANDWLSKGIGKLNGEIWNKIYKNVREFFLVGWKIWNIY